jgi:hypothetical protein
MAGMTEPNSSSPAATFVAPRRVTRREAASACVLAVVSALASAGLFAAAVVGHPPAAVIPLLVIVCVGAPVFGTWQLPHAVAALRAPRQHHRRAIARLRRSLDELPEVEHPLGH